MKYSICYLNLLNVSCTAHDFHSMFDQSPCDGRSYPHRGSGNKRNPTDPPFHVDNNVLYLNSKLRGSNTIALRLSQVERGLNFVTKFQIYLQCKNINYNLYHFTNKFKIDQFYSLLSVMQACMHASRIRGKWCTTNRTSRYAWQNLYNSKFVFSVCQHIFG